jgi:hypothetical protein
MHPSLMSGLGQFIKNLVKSFFITSNSLALDAAGNPVVVWSKEVGKDQQRIYGLRWTGREWVALETAR